MGSTTSNSKTQEATHETPETSPPQSSDRGLIDSPQEFDPALGLDRSLSRQSASARSTYHVYKRRFFGLLQLVLLNIIVSWDWLSYSPVARLSAEYFDTSETAINWLSTSFLFSFCVGAPFTIYTLDRSGPKGAILVASCLLLVGNWVRYGGTRGGNFGAVMFGQILVGLAQPFVLSAPTRYSDVWFSDKGRVSATAVASLANPFGGALAQLIDPLWTTKASDVPNMILYISIISSVACIPSFFIPAGPSTPPSASAAAISQARVHNRSSARQDLTSLITSVRTLFSSPANVLIIIPFWTFVALFNSLSSLISQILSPYKYTDTESGIAGALLILVGLVSAALTSPLIDRYKFFLPYLKTAIPVIGLCYLIFTWAPESRTLVYPYLILSFLGAASFGLVPVALEFLVEISWPLGPEVSSTVCWTGGQFFGGLFIIIENALKDGKDADPPLNMKRALVFQAVLACVIMPLPLLLGINGMGVKRRREEVDRGPPGFEGGIEAEERTPPGGIRAEGMTH